MAKRIPSPQPEHEDVPQGAEVSPYPTTLVQFSNLPDKIAYVDVISAQIFNQNRAAIRDLTNDLGVDLKGNCYDLHDRLSRVIDPDGRLVLPETVLSVGKDNADFSTIQGAVDSISDASIAKVYVVNIYPGVYEENVQFKPNIILRAQATRPFGLDVDAFSPVVIAPPNGAPIQLTTNGNYYLDGVKLFPTLAPAFDYASGYSPTAVVYFSNGTITPNQTPDSLLSEKSNISFVFRDSRIIGTSLTVSLLALEYDHATSFSLEAARSIFRGAIFVDDSCVDSFLFRLSNCLFEGRLTSSAVDSTANLYNCLWRGDAYPLIRLAAGAENGLQVVSSQLTRSDGNFPIERHGSSGTIFLNADHSFFTGSPGADIIGNFADSGNVFGGDHLDLPFFG